MPQILVVDDDVELCELLTDYLAPEGFQVDAVHDGEQGVERALAGSPSLVVLDVMLPGINGSEVLRRIRTTSRVPILMLTARGDEVDRIVGLEMGADDYLPKPFNPRELVARIRAIQRRTEGMRTPRSGAPPIALGDLRLDPGTRTVLQNGLPMELTGVEFSLLEILLSAAGRVVSREELSRQGLDRPLAPCDRSVDVHISNLRRKLGLHPDGLERIKTVRGAGYLYTTAPEAAPEGAKRRLPYA